MNHISGFNRRYNELFLKVTKSTKQVFIDNYDHTDNITSTTNNIILISFHFVKINKVDFLQYLNTSNTILIKILLKKFQKKK